MSEEEFKFTRKIPKNPRKLPVRWMPGDEFKYKSNLDVAFEWMRQEKEAKRKNNEANS